MLFYCCYSFARGEDITVHAWKNDLRLWILLLFENMTTQELKKKEISLNLTCERILFHINIIKHAFCMGQSTHKRRNSIYLIEKKI